MAWTWGDDTGDDVLITLGPTAYASSRVTFVAGWFKPTTLTAGRKLWSVNTTGISGCEIDATTSSVRLKLDATVDGEWTAPAGLTVDTWTFLAVANSNSSGVTSQAWRIWTGTFADPPVEQIVTLQTSPTVAITGSNQFYLGNAGTDVLSWQGDIADVWVMSNAGVGDSNHPLYTATHGTISDAEATLIYETIVLPMWVGTFSNPSLSRAGDSAGVGWHHLDCDGRPNQDVQIFQRGSTLLVHGATPTVNLSSSVYQGSPRPKIGPSPLVGTPFPLCR